MTSEQENTIDLICMIFRTLPAGVRSDMMKDLRRKLAEREKERAKK